MASALLVSAPRPIQILLVDDHPVARAGLRALLESDPDLRICAEVAAAPEAMRAVNRGGVDVALVDLALQESFDGLELIKRMLARRPGLAVLVLSVHDEGLYAQRCLRAGARGYVEKTAPLAVLREAIGKVAAGQLAFSERVTRRVVELSAGRPLDSEGASEDLLTDRELEIFRLVGSGLGTRVIARTLRISHKTVETHKARIKRKLDIADASELGRRAVIWTLLGGRP